MERDFETNSSHLCTNRLALWCPVCGAKENQVCTHAKGQRFDAHNAHAVTSYAKPYPVGSTPHTAPQRTVENRTNWTQKVWER
jgi:hypothetical protein